VNERFVPGSSDGLLPFALYSNSNSNSYLTRIDELFLDNSTPERAYRLETFRSAGHVSSTAAQQLRCYFVARCDFPTPIPAPVPGKRTEIRSVSDKSFLERASPNTLEIYQKIMWNVEDRYGPVIEIFEVEGSREHRIVIGYKMGGISHYFSALSELYHFYGLYSARKYVEQFSNGVTIVSLYLNPVSGAGARNAPPIGHSIVQVMKEASLLYCLPDNPFFGRNPATPGGVCGHAVQEATYAYACWIFAQHFCNRLGPAYLALRGVLDETSATHAEVLNNIKRRFREETFTRQSIEEAILAQPDLVRMLYVHFAMTHYPAAGAQASQLMPTLSYQRLQVDQPLTDEELYDRIRKSVSNKHELQIFESFLVFNQCVSFFQLLQRDH